MTPVLKALFFDQDGVIADTERDGHRVAFNRAFTEYDLGFQWGIKEYGDLLRIGGGKERLAHFLNAKDIGDPALRGRLAAEVHRRKTDVLIEMIRKGELPPRPGVRRVMREAKKAGLIVGICTTSQEASARAIRHKLLGGIAVDFILAGDVVERKKPDPEIYLMALDQTGLLPGECLVVEDSANGVLAASGAGIPVVVTVNDYTRNEDLGDAEIVLSSLGNKETPARVLSARTETGDFGGDVGLDDLVRIHRGAVGKETIVQGSEAQGKHEPADI